MRVLGRNAFVRPIGTENATWKYEDSARSQMQLVGAGQEMDARWSAGLRVRAAGIEALVAVGIGLNVAAAASFAVLEGKG